MIIFAVEGGFTGQLRSLRIAPDGAAVAEVSGRRSSADLTRDQVEAITAELDSSGLFTTGARHSYPPPQGADVQRYEIRYRGATVVAHDTAVPPELTTAVQLLQAALRDVQR